MTDSLFWESRILLDLWSPNPASETVPFTITLFCYCSIHTILLYCFLTFSITSWVFLNAISSLHSHYFIRQFRSIAMTSLANLLPFKKVFTVTFIILTFYLKIFLFVKKSCKDSTENAHIPFRQHFLMFTSYITMV